MKDTENGGQAFPLSYEGPKTFGNPTGRHAEPGMTLRDYFAAGVMGAMFSDAMTISGIKQAGEKRGEAYEALAASAAYQMADAMLVERAK